ncbi:MAG TPA: CoA-transferase, partial [Roseiflexaceae bacterium]
MTDKRRSMRDAIAEYVRDGMSVAIEGFTGFICFAAGHEIIRQRRRDLTLIRMTPDLIYDQMIAAGVARKLVFSYLGNPGVGPLHCLRRAVEQGIPVPLEIEEYSHYGMVGRYAAGAARLPFFPLRSYIGSDMPRVNERIKTVESPYGDGPVAVVPPLNPDLTIIHAQRADMAGNTQIWGLLGVQKEAAFAARNLLVVVEEIVDEAVI